MTHGIHSRELASHKSPYFTRVLATTGTAKAEFKAAWTALNARTTPEDLAAAYKAMNIRDDD